MKKSGIVALSILAVTLSGCGTKWGHPSASQYDFQRDAAQCNLYSQQSNPSQQAANNPYLDNMQRAQQNIQQGGANLGIAINRMNAYDNCMAAKGYYKAN